MLPLSTQLKLAFIKFKQDFQAANLPEGKYIKPPASTSKWYKLEQPCFEVKLQESTLNPLGPLWERSPFW